MQTVGLWIIGILAAVALFAGVDAAVSIASNGAETAGIGTGAAIFSVDDFVGGFMASKAAAEVVPPAGATAPPAVQPPAAG